MAPTQLAATQLVSLQAYKGIAIMTMVSIYSISVPGNVCAAESWSLARSLARVCMYVAR